MTILDGQIKSSAIRHVWGDHRFCGHSCPSSGVDERLTLGYYEETVAALGDPKTVDERVEREAKLNELPKPITKMTRAELYEYILQHRNRRWIKTPYNAQTTKKKLTEIITKELW